MIRFPIDQSFQFGDAVYTRGQWGPISYEHLDLVLLFYGEITITTDGQRNTYGAGNAILAYNEHSLEVQYRSDQEHHSMWCNTGKISLPDEVKLQLKSAPNSLRPSELLLVLMKEGTKLGHDESINISRLRNAIGMAAYCEYFRQAHLEEEERVLPRAVWRAKRHIDEHFTESTRLSDIADVAGLNPCYLHQVFKKSIGVSPIQYMWRLRAEKGRNLLLQTGLTVNEIAYTCGFKSSHHFSRFIKLQYGQSPTKVRAEQWVR